jgi:hypothetical protein
VETNGSNGHEPDNFHAVYKASPSSEFAHLLETKGGQIDCTCGHSPDDHIHNENMDDCSCKTCDCPRWIPDI